jgi:hypothetical protein
LGPEFTVDRAKTSFGEDLVNSTVLGEVLPLGRPGFANREFALPAGDLEFEFDLFAVSSFNEFDRIARNRGLVNIGALIIGPNQQVVGDFGIPDSLLPNFTAVPPTRGGIGVSARGTFTVPAGSSISIGVQNFGNLPVAVVPLVRSR